MKQTTVRRRGADPAVCRIGKMYRSQVEGVAASGRHAKLQLPIGAPVLCFPDLAIAVDTPPGIWVEKPNIIPPARRSGYTCHSPLVFNSWRAHPSALPIRLMVHFGVPGAIAGFFTVSRIS